MKRHSRSSNRSRGSILAVLLVVFVLASPLSASAASFTFMSRGFGHGLGMSQYGAKGFATAGYTYDAILRHYYGNQGTDPKTVVTKFTSETSRDVNLDRAASYGTGGNAGFTKVSWTLRPGAIGSTLAVYGSGTTTTAVDGWSTFTAVGDTIQWRRPGGVETTYSGTIAVWGTSGSPRLTQVLDAVGMYNEQYMRFRGELRLTASGGMIKLVNRVTMPEYLYGVVPRESPASWPMEALKAQAVAARGYARTSTRTELYIDTRDQVYGGHSSGVDRGAPEMHENSRTNDAVDQTLGRCVTYNGVIIRTYFMSTSGGHTENNESVWGSTPLPYLRGVPDPFEVASGSSKHSWTYSTFTDADVRSRLIAEGVSASLLPNPIAGIRGEDRGVSGRPMRIEFISPTGVVTAIEGSTQMDRFKRALNFVDRWFYVNYRTGRIAGVDRYDTSALASKRVFGPSAAPARAVVVANGMAPADALAASSLAGAVGGAPILLTAPGGLSASVAAEITRLGVTTAYIAGGTGVVPAAIEEQLLITGAVTRVIRLAGSDRYGTARAIALEVKRLKAGTEVIVVSGESYADAVAASGFAYAKSIPIVLVRAKSIPADSAATLLALAPTSSLVIGGSGVVGDVVMGKLPGAKRIGAGIDRYDSARQLAIYLTTQRGFNYGSVYIASGPSLVDALAMGPVAGYNQNPLLFAKPYELPSATALELTARKGTILHVHMAGGEGALSGWVQGQIEALLE